jgi:hypothetical protein
MTTAVMKQQSLKIFGVLFLLGLTALFNKPISLSLLVIILSKLISNFLLDFHFFPVIL